MATAIRWTLRVRFQHSATRRCSRQGSNKVEFQNVEWCRGCFKIQCSSHTERFPCRLKKKTIYQCSRMAEQVPSLSVNLPRNDTMVQAHPVLGLLEHSSGTVWCHNVHFDLTIVSPTSVTMVLGKTWYLLALIRGIFPIYVSHVYRGIFACSIAGSRVPTAI